MRAGHFDDSSLRELSLLSCKSVVCRDERFRRRLRDCDSKASVAAEKETKGVLGYLRRSNISFFTLTLYYQAEVGRCGSGSALVSFEN